MMKTKAMRILALLIAALMVFMLAGCEVSTSSSSTTTVTTSKTDENGNTTTTTTTTEIGGSVGTDGVSTTNQTTTTTTTDEADEEDAGGLDESALRDHLTSLYNAGAEGTNEDGDTFYYLFNEDDGHDEALLVIVSADREHYTGWEGEALNEDDHVLLSGEEHDVPFSFEETDDGFTMTFLNDGDVATMEFMDADTVIDDVVAARMEFAG